MQEYYANPANREEIKDRIKRHRNKPVEYIIEEGDFKKQENKQVEFGTVEEEIIFYKQQVSRAIGLKKEFVANFYIRLLEKAEQRLTEKEAKK